MARVGFYWPVDVTDSSTGSVGPPAAIAMASILSNEHDDTWSAVPVYYWLQILQLRGLCQLVGYKLCGH